MPIEKQERIYFGDAGKFLEEESVTLTPAEAKIIDKYVANKIREHERWLHQKMEEMKKDTRVINRATGGEALPGCAECGKQEECTCDISNEAITSCQSLLALDVDLLQANQESTK